MAQRFAVQIQGADPDCSRATGDFDTIDLGEMGSRGLRALMKSFAAMVVPEPDPAIETCPPNMIVECGRKLITFTRDGDDIFCAEVDDNVSLEDAVKLAIGKMSVEDRAPETEYASGQSPVRDTNLKPTPANLDTSRINTGPASPQISHAVWKGYGWIVGFSFLLMWAFIGLLILGIGLEEPMDMEAALGGGAGLALFGWLSMLVRKKGHENLRLGIDSKTNTLWTVQLGKLRYLPNTNCIERLELEKIVGDANLFLVPTGGDGMSVAPSRDETWYITAYYSDGKTNHLDVAFVKKGDAKGVFKKSSVLFKN